MKNEIRILRKEMYKPEGLFSSQYYQKRDYLQQKINGVWQDIPVEYEYVSFSGDEKGLANG